MALNYTIFVEYKIEDIDRYRAQIPSIDLQIDTQFPHVQHQRLIGTTQPNRIVEIFQVATDKERQQLERFCHHYYRSAVFPVQLEQKIHIWTFQTFT